MTQLNGSDILNIVNQNVQVHHIEELAEEI
jgi:hypothetical protein